MKKISVIIPVYNDEKYLSTCLENIIKQTIGFEKNIQLILIDDNSTDESYSICKKYYEKFSDNVILKRLNENSGSGGRPRNIGISYATGEYLMFSDADDFFDKKAFEVMYNAIKSKNADFVISNWNYTDKDGNPYSKPVFDNNRFNDFKLDIKDYINSFWVMNSSMCNKIFNREFIIKNKIECLENVNGEDTYFSYNAFLHSKKVYYIKNITYYYRQRNSSSTVASTSYQCSKNFFDGMNIAYKKIFNLFVESKELEFYRFLYAKNMTYLLYRFIDSEQLNYEEKIQVLTDLKWFFNLSKILKVPVCQKSLSVLIDLIVENKTKEAIDICNILYEFRKFIDPEVKKNISKPSNEIYNEIINNKIENLDNIKKVNI